MYKRNGKIVTINESDETLNLVFAKMPENVGISKLEPYPEKHAESP